MKNIVRVLIFISISLLVLNCATDETIPAKGKVQFAVAVTSNTSNGGKINSISFPSGAYISLSIETASGVSVYLREPIEMIKVADEYVTAPLDLTEGNYRLTDFFIMSKEDEVLYATPKEGSTLASWVTDPLPVNFSITNDGILNLNIQVVSVTEQIPENFGYVSFAVDVLAGSNFSISLFITEDNTYHITSGTLHIYQGDKLLHTQNLLPKVNPINFKGDPSELYTLIVQKEGYATKTREYKLNDLVKELHGSPLSIFTIPAVTYTAIIEENTPVRLLIETDNNEHHEIQIDWGDGVVDTITQPGEIRHDYEITGRHFVNLTGELQSVATLIFSFLNDGNAFFQTMKDVDVTQLSELRILGFNWRTIDTLDVSYNHNLTSLILSRCHINGLNTANASRLKSVNILNTELSNENRIMIIDQLYQNAIERNLREGTMVYMLSYIPPLPESALIKLRSLKNNYGWTVFPDPL